MFDDKSFFLIDIINHKTFYDFFLLFACLIMVTECLLICAWVEFKGRVGGRNDWIWLRIVLILICNLLVSSTEGTFNMNLWKKLLSQHFQFSFNHRRKTLKLKILKVHCNKSYKKYSRKTSANSKQPCWTFLVTLSHKNSKFFPKNRFLFH